MLLKHITKITLGKPLASCAPYEAADCRDVDPIHTVSCVPKMVVRGLTPSFLSTIVASIFRINIFAKPISQGHALGRMTTLFFGQVSQHACPGKTLMQLVSLHPQPGASQEDCVMIAFVNIG